jgi:myo-inositol-1(or 4)-monophosphatase
LAESHDGLWLLDPLDGTTNYALGFPAFCISLALRRGGVMVLGVVHDPLRDECFSAALGAGAFLNGHPLRASSPPVALAEGIGLVDFKRLPIGLAERLLREPPFRSQRNLGASALEWCQVAAGRAQMFLHGSQKPWDYAAGSLILAEAGGFACTLDGEPVVTTALAPRSVLAAPTAALFDEACRWVGLR